MDILHLGALPQRAGFISTLDLMFDAALKAFAEAFVEPGFRDRFLHEATKKPRKLHARICHETDRVLASRYKGRAPRGTPGEGWLLLGNDGFRCTDWEEVSERMKLGNGMLAISSTGDKFYAESEDSSGMEVWAG